jgi:hypothetical protein
VPDWCEIARQGLGPLPFEADREGEIILELAHHLEDLYSDAVRQGKSDAEAVQSALSAAADWDELRREIQLAAEEGDVMNYRIKTLWLPGAFAVALSGIVLRLFQIPTAPSPHVFWARLGSVALVVYWRWLVCLPVIGALGAYWSRHAGGRFLERAVAVSLPALGMVCLPVLVFPFVLVYDLIRHSAVPFVPMALLLLGWGVLPEAALLVGALPFLRGRVANPEPAPTSH